MFYEQGNIPSEIGTMSSLEFLNLEMNQLEGSLPLSIGNLGNLKVSILDHMNSSLFGRRLDLHLTLPSGCSEHNAVEELFG